MRHYRLTALGMLYRHGTDQRAGDPSREVCDGSGRPPLAEDSTGYVSPRWRR